MSIIITNEIEFEGNVSLQIDALASICRRNFLMGNIVYKEDIQYFPSNAVSKCGIFTVNLAELDDAEIDSPHHLVYCLAHEMGHCMLFKQQKNHYNEIFAWQEAQNIVVEIFGQLPSDFEEVRDYYLKTYFDKAGGLLQYVSNINLHYLQNK